MAKATRATEDKAKHKVASHAHSPTHPAAPSPIPCTQHPCQPHMVVKGAATVMTNGKPAARVTDMTEPCMDGMKCPVPVPGGPGTIAKGSAKVMIESMPAARTGDIVMFPSCVLLAGPANMIAELQGGSSDVDIGG